MKKADREIVFNKFGGKCAYCGEVLQKGWHVDEIEPVRRTWEYVLDENGKRVRKGGSEYGEFLTRTKVLHPERFNLDNQYPACASCNINKHSGSLEEFRELIQGFMKHLNEINTQYKIAKRYGLVKEEIKPVVFYFETIKNEQTKTV